MSLDKCTGRTGGVSSLAMQDSSVKHIVAIKKEACAGGLSEHVIAVKLSDESEMGTQDVIALIDAGARCPTCSKRVLWA